MKQLLLILLATILCAPSTSAQEDCRMYNTNNKIDIPLASIGFAGTGFGMYKRLSKSGSDSATILALNTDKMNRWDKGTTQYFNKGRVSDGLFVLGVTSSWVLFTDKQIKQDNGPIGLMYLQAIGFSAMGYALTAGTVTKYRPYAYNPNAPMAKRMSSHAKNSFYCGHPSVMAAGAFFTAKVYSDYYPGSVKSKALWTYAAASTLACGYLRYRGGYHFPSDIVIGMATGTAIGILVPTLHKNRKRPDNNSDGTAPAGDPGAGCQRVSVVINF